MQVSVNCRGGVVTPLRKPRTSGPASSDASRESQYTKIVQVASNDSTWVEWCMKTVVRTVRRTDQQRRWEDRREDATVETLRRCRDEQRGLRARRMGATWPP